MIAPDQVLILTLEMDGDTFGHFNAMRKQHFPPERNIVPAHITLFHHLPSSAISFEQLTEVSQRAPFELVITQPWLLGNGVAFRVLSNELLTIRDALRTQWQSVLTRQDLAGYRPHLTIQNKVEASTAKALLQSLADVPPWKASATGLLLWEYESGPWRFVKRFSFDGRRH